MAEFPLDALGKRVLQLQRSSEKAVEHATRTVAKHHQGLAVDKGGRFRITANGKKYPLDKVTSKQVGRGAVTEFVNEPAKQSLGSWTIITLGSKDHIIGPKGLARKIKRLQGAINKGRKLTRTQARTAASLVTGVGLFEGVKPLNVRGIGPRFVVMHPGHKSIGTPWTDAEQANDKVAERMFDDATVEFMVRSMTT